MMLYETSGAKFSECGKHRYGLWRHWEDAKPCIMFIGLNPSTANATMDDPTIRRVKAFSQSWGFGGVYMANLFSLVSPNPNDLLTCEDPIKENDKFLDAFASNCSEILFAWGAFKMAKARAQQVIEMFPGAICLGKNNDGSPKHPLYIPAKTRPLKFNP